MGRDNVADLLGSSYVLFSCEGTAEAVVIEKLVEADALVVSRSHIVDDPVYFTPYTRLRKADDIAARFLMTSYEGEGATGLVVARIVDSRAGRFSLPSRWKNACNVESFYTRPEIEMLVIHAENAYADWLRASRRNRGLRPSEYCKGELGIHEVKSGPFLRNYWDADKLVQAICEYERHKDRKAKELSLANLIGFQNDRRWDIKRDVPF